MKQRVVSGMKSPVFIKLAKESRFVNESEASQWVKVLEVVSHKKPGVLRVWQMFFLKPMR
jgi:hypothetical protein